MLRAVCHGLWTVASNGGGSGEGVRSGDRLGMVGDGLALNIGDSRDASPSSSVKVVVEFEIVRADEMLTPLTWTGGEEPLKFVFTGAFVRVLWRKFA